MAAPVTFPRPTNEDELRAMSQELNDQLIYFHRACSELRCPALLASFLVISSLIVISASCVCLALPGVNVITHVILPGVLPGGVAIALSIPFIIKSVKLTKVKTTLFDTQLYPRIKTIFDSAMFDQADKNQKVTFIETYLIRDAQPRVRQDFWRTVCTKVMKEYTEAKKAIDKRVEEGRAPIDQRIAAATTEAEKAAFEAQEAGAIAAIEGPATLEKERITKRTDAIKSTLENLMQSEHKKKKT